MHVGTSVEDVFFFFSSRRRHTRSLRDWSSDVCSSDLVWLIATLKPPLKTSPPALTVTVVTARRPATPVGSRTIAPLTRSEERRVGKECRCRWPPDHEKRKPNGNREAKAGVN